MNNKENLNIILKHIENIKDISEAEFLKTVESIDTSKINYSDAEKLISGLDDDKKQLLINILNSVK